MTEIQHLTAERLEAYVEGLLDQAERAVTESHLVGCPRCQHELDEWLALFAALADLPDLEPSPNFADRVMAHVRVSPRWAWQQQAARASAALTRVLPKTTFGWALTTAFLALPILLGAGLTVWLLSQSYLAPRSIWAFFSDQLLEGARASAAAALNWALQTDLAAWLGERGGAFVATAGLSGVGLIAATAALATVLSIWVLYRNLFRTPSRNSSNYALFSF
jgi:anti-sigma factor RsiW